MFCVVVEGEELYMEISLCLFELVVVDQGIFWVIVNNMSGEQRFFLEEVIWFGCQVVLGVNSFVLMGGGQLIIVLKMNFGGQLEQV